LKIGEKHTAPCRGLGGESREDRESWEDRENWEDREQGLRTGSIKRVGRDRESWEDTDGREDRERGED
jgi:hypothetical protein